MNTGVERLAARSEERGRDYQHAPPGRATCATPEAILIFEEARTRADRRRDQRRRKGKEAARTLVLAKVADLPPKQREVIDLDLEAWNAEAKRARHSSQVLGALTDQAPSTVRRTRQDAHANLRRALPPHEVIFPREVFTQSLDEQEDEGTDPRAIAAVEKQAEMTDRAESEHDSTYDRIESQDDWDSQDDDKGIDAGGGHFQIDQDRRAACPSDLSLRLSSKQRLAVESAEYAARLAHAMTFPDADMTPEEWHRQVTAYLARKAAAKRQREASAPGLIRIAPSRTRFDPPERQPRRGSDPHVLTTAPKEPA